MIHFLTLNTLLEFLCFFVALICLRKDADWLWRDQIWFLLITCITELAGIYVKNFYRVDGNNGHPNGWVYNIYLLFQITFLSLVFNHFLKKHTKCKPIIIGGLVLMFLVFVFEVIEHGFLKYNSVTNTVMSVCLVFYSLYYYYYLLKDDAYISLLHLPSFWWVAGVLLFYFGKTACNLFYNMLSPTAENFSQQLRYISYIYYGLNFLMYGLWSYSFICRKWLTQMLKD